jgi:S-methylmethionine-dependent homocysteine/selenocysteine methylase
MGRYRSSLPQLTGRPFLTDGGIETTLVFLDGLNLPHFAAFHLLQTPEGQARLHRHLSAYAAVARRHGTGLILETVTWRASSDWGNRLGYSPASLAEANRRAVGLLESIRNEYETDQMPVVISGCVGPRGDGYVPESMMSEGEAEAYHREQIGVFADTIADMVCAMTMNYAAEAVGVVRAARAAAMPVAISFTVETDGRLATGQTLGSAIEQVDEATGGYPSYYMINCAHPSHFEPMLAEGGAWRERVRGVRANASRKSHAELNESSELDAGDPVELGSEYARLKHLLPRLNVLGGCCGTDSRHVERIAESCLPLFRTAALDQPAQGPAAGE